MPIKPLRILSALVTSFLLSAAAGCVDQMSDSSLHPDDESTDSDLDVAQELDGTPALDDTTDHTNDALDTRMPNGTDRALSTNTRDKRPIRTEAEPVPEARK